MIIIENVQVKRDRLGREYKYFSLFEPRHRRVRHVCNMRSYYTCVDKYCGYILHKPKQHSSKMRIYNLTPGDSIQGHLVTKQVVPYTIKGKQHVNCTVPVFDCDPEEDYLDFEIKLVEAFKESGRVLYAGQLIYEDSEEFKFPNPLKD